jgi:parallel beta-helix repeat protein
MHKTVSGIMLTLLLVGMLTLAFNIQPVKAGTIIVPDDYPTIQAAINAASPGDTIYVRAGTYCENVVVNKTVSLVGENRSNTIIDGNSTGTVAHVSAGNVIITEFTIQNGGTEEGNGIELSSDFNLINGSIIAGNAIGIYVYNSHNNVVENNKLVNNVCGVAFDWADHNVFKENEAVDNVYGIALTDRSDYITVKENHVSLNDYGMYLEHSWHNNITGNEIANNTNTGIYTLESNENTFSRNTITNNRNGILLSFSNFEIISKNILLNNYFGILLSGSSENSIFGNTVLSGYVGIFLEYTHLNESTGNTIISNTIANNQYGIGIEECSGNTIYHNNFINNTMQAGVSLPHVNTWDNGYPCGGNYWSDYTGTDFYSGSYQNITGSDGIGDTPYVIDADNQDRYPLMHPWGSLPVHNINTGLGYAAIQEAINAKETLDGHTIFVEAGIYREHVFVNKTINLIGEGRVVTIIDVYEVDVTANDVAVSGFAIGGFTAFAEGKKGNGIRLEADGCTVDNNTIFNASPYGVWLLNSTNNVISNNVMIANDNNVMLTESSNNTISQNYIRSIEWPGGGIKLMYSGIELYRCSNNTIIRNNITQCRRGIGIEGRTFYGDYASNNTIIENNIEYLGEAIWSIGCGISLSWASNNQIVRNKIIPLGGWGWKEEARGVYLYCSFNNSIVKNNIEQNGEGIKLVDSSLNNITDNNLIDNFYGILLEGSQVNSLTWNNITHSPMISEGSNETRRVGYGILIYSYYSNLLRNNSIAGYMYNFGMENGYYFQDIDASNTVDGKPIYYWVNRESGQIPSDAGYVAIINSTNIRVEGLDLKNNYQGILIAYSNNITIRQNNIANNDYGIWLYDSSNNRIYHNNFINNTSQVYSYQLVNVWDDGYPSGGNYWSDYVGVDVKGGPNQDLPGSDGIGDTPYIIDADNRDRYPLMNPYGATPPPTYALTITATFGGTTDPAPGTYSYTANSTVQVTAIPNTDHPFDHWELDSANVGSANPYTVLMDKDHTLKAVFELTHRPPPSASINPLSASINVGQSVTFTSTVSGGYTPYTYQWYLNGAPVSGATSSSWTLAPTTAGIYYVYLKVTDAKANTAQSETARAEVAAVPVGGYSIPIKRQNTPNALTLYLALIAIFATVFTAIRRRVVKVEKGD